jgi:predicted amidohydrolase
MKKLIRFSLIQMDVKLGDIPNNLNKISTLITEASLHDSSGHPHIICLPELCTTGFNLENHRSLAEQIPGGKTTEYFKEIAQKNSVYIVTSIIEKENENFFNTAIVISEKGKLIHKYRKVHLFPLDPMAESLHFTEGVIDNTNIYFKIRGLKMGVLICFDVRFPEISRRMALEGVEWLIYVAEFPRPRSDVWNILLQARAMENQMFVIGVNRVGGTDKISYFGESKIFDPFGDCLISGSNEEQTLSVLLDINSVKEARTFIPTLDLRKPESY